MKGLLFAAAAWLAAPVAAQIAPLPPLLTEAQRADYRAVFADLKASRWDSAAARLDGMGDGPLHAVARAEIATARGAPAADPAQLSALLERAPDLPEAPQIAALLRRRGGDLVLPTLPQPRQLVPTKGAPRRLAGRTDRQDTAAARLNAAIKPYVKEDRAGEMEGELLAAQEALGPQGRTEYQQRIAWTYYLAGDDENALRLALTAGQGQGDFAVAGDWVAGLSAWRLDRCDPAGQAFQSVASKARDDEMRAAGWFWSARADLACRHPERVQAKLRAASRIPETFYGLLATRMLGVAPPPPAKPVSLAAAEWSALRPHSNAQAAVALAEVGELGLADTLIRWQARIGRPQDHLALTHLAGQLDLPGTQVFLAHNTPDGVRPELSARYPAPGWTPANGWLIDRQLVMAHSLEESVFRVSATSQVGAKGLMGIMPGTAELLDRRAGLPPTNRATLNDPVVNMAYGQRMLQYLRDLPSTGGLLPKVIAAYNAGPGSNIKWNPALRDRGDPLLWIESIPYIETRAYVGLVLRNYWIYQAQAARPSTSLDALAQGLWPRFPGLSGATALRMDTPARAPVRLAVVMPRPKVPAPLAKPLPDADDETEVMVADAAPVKPSPVTAPVPVRAAAAAPAPLKAAAPARTLASAAADTGAKSLSVVKDVARSLAAPVVRAKALNPAAPALDSMIGAVLKAELPVAKAGVARAAASVKQKVAAPRLKLEVD